MYHRICDPLVDPWDIAVAPDLFDAQIEELRQNRSPMRLGEFVDRLQDDTLPDDAVAVTFDDGYLDNLRVAVPCLARHGVPATIFVTTGYVGRTGEFWWDELARIVLTCPGAVDQQLVLGGQRVHLALPADEAAGRGSRWRAPDGARTDRQKAYLAIWRLLRDLKDEDITAAMMQVRAAVGAEGPRPGEGPMALADVADLAKASVIDIGAHTVSHPPLTVLRDEDRVAEVAASKAECERLFGSPITGFSYPHGEYDERTEAIVQAAGFAWACSAENEAISGGATDVYALPRVQAMSWSPRNLAAALTD